MTTTELRVNKIKGLPQEEIIELWNRFCKEHNYYGNIYGFSNMDDKNSPIDFKALTEWIHENDDIFGKVKFTA